MLFKSLLAVTAAALAVNAQSTTSSAASATPSVSECITTCLASSLSAGGCTGITDVTCLCTSTAFQSAALACLQANCTAADLQASLQLQQAQCAAISTSSSGATSSASGATSSATRASSAMSSGTGSSASASSTAPTNTPNAAMSMAPVAIEGLVGILIAGVGALVGAAFVL